MKIKKIAQESIVCGVLAIAVLMPISHDVNATSAQENLANYQAYPTPVTKPFVCSSSKEDIKNDSHVSKKQAAVAALGLYLGLKQAVAAQDTLKEQQNLCA